MSKTVYLITTSGFIAFGTGCTLTIDAGNVLAMSPSGFGIQLHFMGKYTEKSDALLALWGAAIAHAPDGALLRWDEEKQDVVDELEADDSAFEEAPLLASLPSGDKEPVL